MKRAEHTVDEWLGTEPSKSSIQRSICFGDGNHPSTRLAQAGLVSALLNRPRGASVLDAGCGTGILSELATELGAIVTAIDRDPVACERTVARCTATVVHSELAEFLLSQERIRGFAIVVANIAECEHEAVIDQLWAAVAPSGQLIVSGLPLSRAQRFERQLRRKSECANTRLRADSGWAAIDSC